jgi:general stress protein YciG
MNTAKGGAELRQTMIEKYGSEEAWRQHLRHLGSLGGKTKNSNKGFGSNRQLASEAGRRGGSKSRRRRK